MQLVVVPVGHKVMRVLLEDPVVVVVAQRVVLRVVPQQRVKVMRVVLVRTQEVTVVVVAVGVLAPPVVMVVIRLVVTVVQVNSLGREVPIRISGTSTVKAVGLRVAVVEEHLVVLSKWGFRDAGVVVTDKDIVGTRLRVVRHTVWYIRVAVAVVVEHRIEMDTRDTPGMVLAMLRPTVEAVVRVLFLFKRTSRLQTVRIRQSSRSETRVGDVYYLKHTQLIIWGRKLTGSLS